MKRKKFSLKHPNFEKITEKKSVEIPAQNKGFLKEKRSTAAYLVQQLCILFASANSKQIRLVELQSTRMTL